MTSIVKIKGTSSIKKEVVDLNDMTKYF